jgi:hypothetical protein
VWVAIGLWKVASREAALGYMWLCIIASIASIAAGLVVHPQYFISAPLILAALWYWLAIRWVDRNA